MSLWENAKSEWGWNSMGKGSQNSLDCTWKIRIFDSWYNSKF